jgi:hypothetical protein
VCTQETTGKNITKAQTQQSQTGEQRTGRAALCHIEQTFITTALETMEQ